ncbi:hypothetical protein R3P38DRAFT_1966804 [Favolaschia claudopus]|uniref:Uncharacterized protein n=1 Tax=Favolaschia claudopus TaxID=2862362 RepID=A0AAV9ZZE6_9AGAR
MSRNLDRITTRAADLCIWCSTIPNISQIQQLSETTLELCKAATSMRGNSQVEKLAAFVVENTEILASQALHVAMSPEIAQNLKLYAEKLDDIRRTLKRMALQRKPTVKWATGTILARKNPELRRLKAEMKKLLHRIRLNAIIRKSSELKDISRSDCALEIVSLGTKTLSAISEAPGLNLLKPALGAVSIICDQTKLVRRNREAALELARHSSAVIQSIVNHTKAVHVSRSINTHAFEEVGLVGAVLQDIQAYLATLKKPRRRLPTWIMADQEKDRISRLESALDKALALFTSVNALETHAALRNLEIRELSGSKVDSNLMISVSNCGLSLHSVSDNEKITQVPHMLRTSAVFFLDQSKYSNALDTYLRTQT